MLILLLAANTSFADFPRLAFFLARDRFIPRQFANQGDRLVFSNGILILGGLAGAARRRVRRRHPRAASRSTRSASSSRSRSRRAAWCAGGSGCGSRAGRGASGINGVGAAVDRHRAADDRRHEVPRRRVDRRRCSSRCWSPSSSRSTATTTTSPRSSRWRASTPPPPMTHTVLVLVGDLHRGVVRALQYAQTLSPNAEGGLRRDRSRAHAAARGEVGQVGHGRAAGGPDLALPVAAGAAARVHRPSPAPARRQPRGDDRAAGVHPRPLVAAPPAQPDRAARSRARCSSARTSSSPTSRTT